MSIKILVTGATGYVGGRLIPLLLENNYEVKVLARNSDRLRDYSWRQNVEIVEGDARDFSAVKKSVEGVDIIYYLLHSIVLGEKLAETEELIANNFAFAAKDADVKRFIYLGAIVPDESSPKSIHLTSRHNVGKILRNSDVPTIELRAAVIIGSGSASFEMLRYLTERLPIMITPKWLSTKIQPIAIRDVLQYLVESAKVHGNINDHFDIAGSDIFTYKEMMQEYAKIAELKKRIIITLPILTPKLSSLWINLVTPVPSAIARPLVNSLTTEVIAHDTKIITIIPDSQISLLSFDLAVSLALEKVRDNEVLTRWSGALSSDPIKKQLPSDPSPTDPNWSGGTLYVDDRTITTDVSVEKLWKVIESIGGNNGWYSFKLAWQFRGFIDRLFGGVGMRRGRRDPNKLHIGDALDFWRVEEKIDNQLLRLIAEMKLPGQAWLELSIDKTKNAEHTIY
jgi:uncharacterized protein YbjT (DUF2867 family)